MFNKLIQTYFKPKRVLFYRDFQTFTGGHQKVGDYFAHLRSTKSFRPSISFSESTIWDESNPWLDCEQSEYMPNNYDYVFLAGMDWQKYLSVSHPPHQPVINLIQHVRHADAAEPLNSFLKQRAIRICVSRQVSEAIAATGQVNGPIFTIPNGVSLPDFSATKIYDVVILAIKQNQLGREINELLTTLGLKVLFVDQQVLRTKWFEYLSQSRVALLLPNLTEGFYLPALEAMNYCDLVVVPDCVGNRDFCIDGKNCLMPRYDREAILTSTMHAISLLDHKQVLTEFKREMSETVKQHSLAAERKAFLKLMNNVGKLWAESF